MIDSPMHQGYVMKAPGGEASWPDAVREMAGLIGQEYDWSAEVPSITAPTLLVYADWDAVRMPAVLQFYEMLGGAAQDANWDRSGMGEDHLAVIPNATHYDILMTTAVSDVAIPFLDGYPQPAIPPAQ
jgi:hypothetical protein